MDIKKLKFELRRDEGLRLIPYRCTAGHWTCGYGHNLSALGYSQERIDFLTAHPIRLEQADEWLIEDISEAMASANNWLGLGALENLSEARQRAVVNMAFNLGSRLWEFGRLKAHMLAGRWIHAAHEMLDSKWGRQVGSRAVRLAAMMREG